MITGPADPVGAMLARIAARQAEVNEVIGFAEAVRSRGGKQEAAELYKAWIANAEDQPFLHAVYFNYSVVLSDLGDLSGAIIALRETIRLKPEFCPPYINLGSLYERLGQADRAVGEWMTLVNLFPTVIGDAIVHKTMAMKQIGRMLEGNGNDGGAEEVLKRSLDIDPSQADVVQHLISLRQRQCKWPVIEGLARLEPRRMLAEIPPLSAACHTDDPLFQLAAAHRHNLLSVGLPGRADLIEPASRHTDPQGRLRIGYLSSDLRAHAVGFGMAEVMELHSRAGFEIHAYYCGIPVEDAMQTRIRQAVDRWTSLNGLDDRTAAERIAADGIDILVDLNGYTKDARTRVFARRPAPIAVNWFGFPHTMGSAYHHYIIADEFIIPTSHEIYYSEQVARLACYQPNDRHRFVAPTCPTRSELGLPEDGIVYCCLNGLQKLTRMTFERWMVILQQVPDSVLWLLSGSETTNWRVRQMAGAFGIPPERIVFAARLGNAAHVARYARADLFLDTLPYGSHTSASDALWMGLPILTLAGRSFAARVCGSLVRAAGLPELVTSTPVEYVRRAVELGRDRVQLAALRQRLIAGRDTCLLYDVPRLVSDLEGLYRMMWQAYLRGERPQPDLRNLAIYHEIGLDEDLTLSEMLSDEAYLARYRERLADRHAIEPVPPDGRLWRA